MSVVANSYGQIAYEAYFAKCGGKSLISGAPLPEWSAQSEATAQAAADARSDSAVGSR